MVVEIAAKISMYFFIFHTNIVIFFALQIFQTAVANKIRVRHKAIIDWNVQDVVNWLKNVNLDDIVKNAMNANLDGQRLLTVPEDRICSALDLSKYR